jgi:D-alanyl-D-alanine-carboxypeptidase/D-alanyl-D-alanine-endopeptidase
MAILLVLLPGLLAAAGQEPPDLAQELRRLAGPLIEARAVVGLVAAVERDGRRHVAGFGETRKGSGRAPDAKTAYEIGSITKTFTGLLLADAVGRGELALEDTLGARLPPEARPDHEGLRAVTLEHLATHASGLPRLPDGFRPADPLNPYADYSKERLYAFLKGHAPRRPPGTYEYSNLAMGLLGHLLELRTGLGYEPLVRERICRVLGLGDTGMALEGPRRERLAPPYDAALSPQRNWDLSILAGAGGLRSTAEDLLRYAAAHGGGEGPLREAMTLALKPRLVNAEGIGVGLGWHLARDGRTRLHSGMTGGYASFVAVVPDARTAVVVLSNTASGEIAALGEKLVQAAFGLKPAAPEPRRTVPVEEKVLAGYAGEYPLAPGFVLTVTVEDGALHVQATGQPKLRIYASSETEFFYREVEARITFVPGPDGRAERLILHQNGMDMPATRRR